MMRTQMDLGVIQLVPFFYCIEEPSANPRSSSSCNKEHTTQCSCPTVEGLDTAAPPRFK
jgi:hypothetical protein